MWGTSPFVPLSQAHTCQCVPTVRLWSIACGQRDSGEEGRPGLTLSWTAGRVQGWPPKQAMRVYSLSHQLASCVNGNE